MVEARVEAKAGGCGSVLRCARELARRPGGWPCSPCSQGAQGGVWAVEPLPLGWLRCIAQHSTASVERGVESSPRLLFAPLFQPGSLGVCPTNTSQTCCNEVRCVMNCHRNGVRHDTSSLSTAVSWAVHPHSRVGVFCLVSNQTLNLHQPSGISILNSVFCTTSRICTPCRRPLSRRCRRLAAHTLGAQPGAVCPREHPGAALQLLHARGVGRRVVQLLKRGRGRGRGEDGFC